MIKERSTDREVTLLSGLGLAECEKLSGFIQVPLPGPEQLNGHISNLEKSLTLGGSAQTQRTEATVLVTDGEARDALDIADEILENIDQLPSRAEGFAESVEEKAQGIRDDIEKRNRVTGSQLTALENMLEGVRSWLERG